MQEVTIVVRNEGGAGHFWLSAAEQAGDSHVQVAPTSADVSCCLRVLQHCFDTSCNMTCVLQH